MRTIIRKNEAITPEISIFRGEIYERIQEENKRSMTDSNQKLTLTEDGNEISIIRGQVDKAIQEAKRKFIADLNQEHGLIKGLMEKQAEYFRKRLEETSLKLRQKESKPLTVLQSFRFILPPRYREEFQGDIEEIYDTLKEEGYSKIWIYFILSLNFANVIWASIRFKYSEYFEKARSVRKSE